MHGRGVAWRHYPDLGQIEEGYQGLPRCLVAQGIGVQDRAVPGDVARAGARGWQPAEDCTVRSRPQRERGQRGNLTAAEDGRGGE